MEPLHVGPVVVINPRLFFPCTKGNMRRLLFIAGEDREKVGEDIRTCLKELMQICPEYTEQYQENVKMLEDIMEGIK